MATPKAGYIYDGKRLPGTTTIIGRFKESGGLLQWAFKQGQEGRASLYEKRDEAADIGTRAHTMVEQYLNGETPVEDHPDAINAFNQFRKWEQQTKIKLLSKYQEIQLVSPDYLFGGTPDAIGELDGEVVLLDWKTSSGVYCVTPGHKVLTRDLRWVPVEDLHVGQALLAFSENRSLSGNGGRRWEPSTVTYHNFTESEVMRIVLESGEELVATPEHMWLARCTSGGRSETEGGTLWRQTRDLRPGNTLPKYLDVWDSRVLGQIRPLRLLDKFSIDRPLMASKSDRNKIVAVESAGKQTIVNLSTSSKTYFVNGYGSHNSDYVIQLAAYRHLIEYGVRMDTGEKLVFDKPLSGGAHLLRFSKEAPDFGHHYFGDLADAWDQFKLYREAYEIDKKLKARVK